MLAVAGGRGAVKQKPFSLAVQYAAGNADPVNLPTRTQFRRWVKSALERQAGITIRMVNAPEGRALNHDYRGKDYATNVLTFVYDEMDPLSADIVLCVEIVEQEAQRQRKALLAHYAHLTVHGVLHAQGYDHIEEGEAVIMEQKEIEILARLGFDNPYAENGGTVMTRS
ncbi:MAG: rRNA maturation RNase YbeY [Nitrosomonas sp.]|nr:rRNA maturation RNase YbeY [Nitrosomonas sp.]